MQPLEVRDIAARHVPGTGEPEISRPRAGLVNETYRVVRDGRAYALRIAAANPRALGLEKSWELQVLERAGAARLAPRVDYADARRGILVLRWVDGREWRCADAPRPDNIARIAELLRRIHALPVPRPARRMRPSQWIDLYASVARPVGPALEALAGEKLAALHALPAVPATLCHSDLHVLNLVDQGDSLILLDWEYAHVSDPLWDVAGWSANNDFAAEDALRLLTAYAGAVPLQTAWSRLQILCWLYDYVCLLWSELYLSLGAADTREGVAQRALVLRDRLSATPSGRGG
jgi:thiamine kinase-like enzyme